MYELRFVRLVAPLLNRKVLIPANPAALWPVAAVNPQLWTLPKLVLRILPGLWLLLTK
ncbi:hypothetical protein D3C72_2378240 [compost metagenome]